ncbi:DUF2806 domain-containing protein [Spirosoma sp. KCTC 42546]|uniref:DUF2806 domain-containing protein n=1 Tax=Spirosoma sp. KCTC 42546 TaxID=2520506 RepID=UPI00143CE2C7|nr:DUF2806 domain-containing protein [Spirosoma sp. KCTC 42546]
MLPELNSDNLNKAGELVKQTAGYLKLADIIRNILGEQAALFLFRKKTTLEAERAQQLAEVELSKKFIDKSIDNFASTEEGKYTMSAVGAAFAHQQLRKFNNLSNIIDTALEELEQKESAISEKAVDEDWVTRFLNYAGDVSNDEIQRLWGRVLAGEIARPSSFSVRTIEFLKNVSKVEAEIINDMAKVCLSMNVIAFLPGRISDYTSENQSKLSQDDLTRLDELGLIQLQNKVINLTITHSQNQTYITFNYGRFIVFFDVITDLYNIYIPAISLNQTANELRQLIDFEIDTKILMQVKKLIIDAIGNKHPMTCKYIDSRYLKIENYGRGQTILIYFRTSKNEKEIILN